MKKNKSALFLVLILSLPVLAQDTIFLDGFENHDPVIISSPPLSGAIGEAYFYDIDATDVDGDELLYLLEAGPGGMAVNAISGELDWTPGSSGAFPVSIDVSDGQGGSASQSWTITVTEGQDSDSDGLGDITEEALGTDPNDPDSDDDGLLDGQEVNIHDSDPLDPDTDRDELSDGDEVDTHGTDPVDLDTDGDDFGDGLELKYGTDPLNPADYPAGPPDPDAIAPPNDPSVNTTLFDATEFLFNGTPPVQTGVSEGAIDALRVAVMRGLVMERDGSALPGAVVTVLDHPEYGQTTSRVDGRYDLVANGGSVLTVDVQKAGYLSAQRQADVPWQDYLELPDIALVPLDSQVTAVDLTTGGMQVAAGSPVSDSDGDRQAALLFPAGTTAELMLEGGGTQPIENLNVRATEYTVGENGPEAMPGGLPPASGYTYAVELSVDQAMGGGVSGIQFNQPLYSYTDNFLGFPVGSPVPAGYYDKETSSWIASRNGLVIKIVGISGDLAEIDVNGDDVADTGTALSDLGIDDAERQSLAASYSIAQELWRVPVEHFTPWDYNWPYGPPADAVSPMLPSPQADSEEIQQCIMELPGSIIESQNQAVREEIPITGTPYMLTYRSTDVPDRKNSRTLKIPLSGESVPASLKRIELDLSIAGQTHHQSFPAAPDQSATYTWNGKDAYQRDINGVQVVRGTVGYVYEAVYYEPDEFEQAFNRFGGQALEGNPGREEIILYQPFSSSLGSFDARSQGLGGWRLDVHHYYDPLGKALRSGAGYTQGGAAITQRTIETVAGVASDEEGGFNGDDQPATSALLDSPTDVLAMPDGAILIADEQNNRIRRVGPDGIITTIAGTGNDVDSGDGGLAAEAELKRPQSLARGPDGSIYILTWTRLRRITPDGMIDTIAGSDLSAYGGDGGPASEATLYAPYGLDVAADGTVYIVSASSGRVRRIGTDGIIDTVAGSDGSGPTLGGIPAREAVLDIPKDVLALPDGGLIIAQQDMLLYVGIDGILQIIAVNTISPDWPYETLKRPYGLALGPDAAYFADRQTGQVGKIDQQGVQTVVAGVWDAGEAYGDGGPPLSAGFYQPVGLSIDSLGQIYIADRGASHIRRIGSATPGFGESDIGIASPDGGMYYQFNKQGRHLRSYSTLTGAVLHEFSYTSDGQLDSITDGDGKTTTIQRDGEGRPTGILSPFGQLTALSLDINGFVKTLTNPASEQVQIESSPGGLIERWADPRGKISSYTYDAQGLLLSQSDNAGFEQSLVRTPLLDGFSVSRTTGLGRTTQYDVEISSSQVQSNTNTLPDGSQDRIQIQQSSGNKNATGVAGMSSQLKEGPDPRFSMQSPIVQSFEISAPEGPMLVVSSSSEASLSNPADPLSLQSLSATSTIDGRTTTSNYESASKTQMLTSPEGRSFILVFDELGRVVSSQYADLEPTIVSYNTLGQLETMIVGTGPDARKTSITYEPSGFRASLTDPLGRVAALERDAAGRVTRKILPGSVNVDFSFTAAGDLNGITPPGRLEHTFSYNLRGQLTSISPPPVADTGLTTLAYNIDQQLTSILRPGGEELVFHYDNAGRTQSIELKDGELTDATYTFSYVLAGRPDTITGPGAQTVSYEYQGDLVTGVHWGGVVAGSVAWQFDNSFRVINETVTGGSTVDFTYDNDDLLTSAGDFFITRSAANGLAQSATLGLASDSWTYNSFGEVEGKTVTANGITVYDADFTRDKLSRITQKVETIESVTDTYDYVYGPRGQLIGVRKNDVVIESYGYDDNGNRTSATVNGITVSGTYDNQDRLLSHGDNTYSYTPAGRLLARTEPGDLVTSYDYDAAGNLLSVVLPDGVGITYGLDGPDRRVQRSVDGSITHRWLYDDILPVAELDESGNVVSQFIYAGGHVPSYFVKGGVNYRIVTDQVGSVRLVVNSMTGAITQRLDYDSFGIVTSDSNPGFQPFGFAGGLYDPATGLIRFGTRDFDPKTGRWTAKDMIGFAGNDTNLYRYTSNNPVNFVDSTGLDFWDKANGFLNGLGEKSAHRNWASFFQGIGGGFGLLAFEGLDLLFGFDEPHIGDFLPEPTSYEGFSDFYEFEFYGGCTAEIAEFAIDTWAGGAAGKAGIAANRARAEATESAALKAKRLAEKAARRKNGDKHYSSGKAADRAADARNGGRRHELKPRKYESEALPSTPGNGVGGFGVN